MGSKKKFRRLVKTAPIFILVAILMALPLAGVACGDDDDGGGGGGLEAKFDASTESGVGPLDVQFTDKSNGEIDEWLWDFGDDNTSTDQNPSHIYAEEGLYTVTLEVTGPDGTDTESKFRYISVAAMEYSKKTFTLSTAASGEDPAAAAAQEFADLLEGYTAGRVKVTVYPGGTLYSPQEEMSMLTLGSCDIIWQSPVVLRMLGYGYTLDPFTSVDRMIPSIAFGRALVDDGRVLDIVDDKLQAIGAKLLGSTDSNLVNGIFTKDRELNSVADCKGLKFGTNYPGVADPWHQYAGFELIYVPFSDRSAAVTLGTIDTLTASLALARTGGYADLFNNMLLWVAYSPYYGMMNLDLWDDLDTDLQDLIMNKIMPEVITYTEDYCITQHKKDLEYLVEGMATVHLETPAMSRAIWDVIKNYDSTKAILAAMDPEMLSIINELTPTTFDVDPVVVEILDYAGIHVE